MKNKLSVIAGFLIAMSAAAWAQMPPPGGPGGPGGQEDMGGPGGMGPRPGGGPPAGDMMSQNFFPPELIMRHQQAINLTADQQQAIRAEMGKVMERFTDLQWDQSAEQETMTTLLKQQPVDEKQTLAQFDKLLATENEIKRLHLGSMIRIKNILTADQQSKLRELQQQDRPARRQSGSPSPSQPGGPPPQQPGGPPQSGDGPPPGGGPPQEQ